MGAPKLDHIDQEQIIRAYWQFRTLTPSDATKYALEKCRRSPQKEKLRAKLMASVLYKLAHECSEEEFLAFVNYGELPTVDFSFQEKMVLNNGRNVFDWTHRLIF